jgi:hypothetical protein
MRASARPRHHPPAAVPSASATPASATLPAAPPCLRLHARGRAAVRARRGSCRVAARGAGEASWGPLEAAGWLLLP